jgi:hypothetical protein
MVRKLGKTKQNLILAAAYIKINEEGRIILDMVTQKLGEIHWPPKINTREDKHLKKCGKTVKEFMCINEK